MTASGKKYQVGFNRRFDHNFRAIRKAVEAGDVDTAVITLKLTNGATAVIDNCRACCYGYDQRAEVFGDKGCVAISNDSDSNAVYSNADGVTAEKPMYFFLERYMQAYANEVNEFIEAIVNDTDTPVTARDGLEPVLIGLAATKSARATLTLSPPMFRILSLQSATPKRLTFSTRLEPLCPTETLLKRRTHYELQIFER